MRAALAGLALAALVSGCGTVAGPWYAGKIAEAIKRDDVDKAAADFSRLMRLEPSKSDRTRLEEVQTGLVVWADAKPGCERVAALYRWLPLIRDCFEFRAVVPRIERAADKQSRRLDAELDSGLASVQQLEAKGDPAAAELSLKRLLTLCPDEPRLNALLPGLTERARRRRLERSEAFYADHRTAMGLVAAQWEPGPTEDDRNWSRARHQDEIDGLMRGLRPVVLVKAEDRASEDLLPLMAGAVPEVLLSTRLAAADEAALEAALSGLAAEALETKVVRVSTAASQYVVASTMTANPEKARCQEKVLDAYDQWQKARRSVKGGLAQVVSYGLAADHCFQEGKKAKDAKSLEKGVAAAEDCEERLSKIEAGQNAARGEVSLARAAFDRAKQDCKNAPETIRQDTYASFFYPIKHWEGAPSASIRLELREPGRARWRKAETIEDRFGVAGEEAADDPSHGVHGRKPALPSAEEMRARLVRELAEKIKHAVARSADDYREVLFKDALALSGREKEDKLAALLVAELSGAEETSRAEAVRAELRRSLRPGVAEQQQ